MTITRVELRNYRSIESCDVPLSDLTLLVGPNGSGKSNFLDMLSFVQEAMESVRDAVRRRGGMRDLSFQGSGEFSLGLTVKTYEGGLRYWLTIATLEHGSPGVLTELLSDAGDGRCLFHVRSGVVTEGDGRGAEVRSDRLYLDDYLEDRVSGPVGDMYSAYDKMRNGLLWWTRFEPDPGILRLPQDPDPEGLLHPNGFNVPAYYRGLSEDKAEIVQSYLRMIVPGLRHVEGVALPEPESLETVRFTVAGRDGEDFVLPARAMSDGTLRAFIVLVALFSESVDSGIPIGIEEPEASLHPAAARVLLDALKEASERRQIIATTHSPDLLDDESVQAEEILAVRYLRGRSYVGPLDQVGRKALADSLFTAGELLQKDHLLPEAPPGEESLRFDA